MLRGKWHVIKTRTGEKETKKKRRQEKTTQTKCEGTKKKIAVGRRKQEISAKRKGRKIEIE